MGEADTTPTTPSAERGEVAPAGTREQIEIERKFTVPRRWTLPRLAGVGRVEQVAPPARMTQSATYLDTPGLAVFAAKRTLRRRIGGTDAGWHLKSPADAGGRRELHADLGRGIAFVPEPLRAELADIVGNDPLVPICVLRTRRVRRRLLGPDDVVLALLEDDTVEATVLRDGERIVRWREIELELVDGDDADLDAVSSALQASGLAPSDLPSKLGYALAEAGADRPRELRRAGDVVLAYLGAQVGVLQSMEQAVREDRPDAVHKARVATRRLRSALRTYRSLFDRSVTDPLRAEIKWLTGVLGGPRDAEVIRARLLELLDALPDPMVRGPVTRRLRDALEADHARAHERLVAALDGRRYERLMAALLDLLLDPPLASAASEPASTTLPPLVAAASAKVEKLAKVARKATDPVESEEAIHSVRKEAKAARYAAEAAGTSAGTSAKKVAGAWSDLQEALGDHQDSVVAREVLERIYRAARKAGEDTFTYGVLVEREAALAREVESHYESLLTEARAAAKALGS